MPAISPRLGEFLIKVTGTMDIENAFQTVFYEYIQLKIKNLQETAQKFQNKWGMSFEKFQQVNNISTINKNIYDYDVEKDFWVWEETETLKNHYEKLMKEWI